MELTNVRLLQVWQYAAQAERSLDQVVATARRYGFTGVLVKPIDGLTWMGDIRAERPYADALRSVEQARAQRAQVNAAGLQYCLWTVPLWREDRIAQARLSAELTGACDALFLDVKPYPEFWGANQPEGDAAAFMATLRSVAPVATVVLQPDPRPARMTEIRAAEWLPHCDGLAGQHYWDTFATDDPAAQMQLAMESAKPFNAAVIPTLPLASSPELLQDAIATLRKAGVTSWCAWRLGVGSEALLAVAGGGGAARLAGVGPAVTAAAPTLDHTLTRTTIADVLGGWRGRLAVGPLSPAEAAQAAFEIRSAAAGGGQLQLSGGAAKPGRVEPYPWTRFGRCGTLPGDMPNRRNHDEPFRSDRPGGSGNRRSFGHRPCGGHWPGERRRQRSAG